MASSGSLKDFKVPEVIQLIAREKKTGVLRFTNGAEDVQLFMRKGSVTRARSSSRPGHLLLGRLLVRSAIITERQLEDALQEQKQSKERVGDVLLRNGVIEAEIFQQMTMLQSTETIFALFEWTDGHYSFEPAAVEEAEGEAINAQAVIKDGVRMLAEWPKSLRDKMPPFSWEVHRTNKQLDSMGFSDLRKQAVYRWCHDGRTVQSVVDRSRIGQFEACYALADLIEEGWIGVSKPERLSFNVTSDSVAEWGIGRRARIRWAVRFGLSAVITYCALLFASGAVGAGAVQLSANSGALMRARAESQMRVVKRALDVYHKRKGVYPEALQSLVDVKLLGQSDLDYPFGLTFEYKTQGQAYTLRLPVVE